MSADPTTNAAIRRRYEAGKRLSDAAVLNTVEVSPGNGAVTTPGADTDVHVVNPDGTNSVDLDAVAEQGRTLTVVHNGGSNTPLVFFADSDFVGTAPANLDAAGDTATVQNIDGTNAGWVVLATGSA